MKRSAYIWCIIALTILRPLAPHAAGQETSSAAQRYMFGRGDFAASNCFGAEVGAVVVADFNGDGILDLAAGDSCGFTSGTVSILLGMADGTFQAPVGYPIGSPGSLVVADFNRDGKLDVAVSNCTNVNCAPGTISILLGNGDGTFRAPLSFATGTNPGSLSVGDFNGDGNPDLVVSNSNDNAISVLIGKGDGTFQNYVEYATGNQPKSLRIGDFNGDGKLDVAIANYNSTCNSSPCGPGSVSILLGKGDGTFQTHVDYPTGTQPGTLLLGEFNGDGRLDLAVTNFDDNTVSILLGKGDGTFQPQVAYGVGSHVSSLVADDFNRDGKIDLATANGDNTVSILLGHGDGTFQAQAMYAVGATFGRAPIDLVVGDFNGDGKLDLAVGNFCSCGGSVSILQGKGDGTFPTHREYATGSFGGTLVTGDFNGDGKLDLVRSSVFFNEVTVLLGRGDGTFGHRPEFATGSHPKSATAGDFNGDGNLDLSVVDSSGNTVSILLGHGDGTFQTHADYATGSTPVSVAAGDFNRDGRPDLAVANRGSNTVSILPGNGDGTFQAHVDYATGPAPSSVAIGDFNGDGKLDLAITNSGSNTVSILLGKGDGTFQPHVDHVVHQALDSVAVGDLNGDGKLDLAVASFTLSTVSILLGNGDGTFRPHFDYTVGLAPRSLIVGDFDGDGIADVAVADSGNREVSILRGNPDIANCGNQNEKNCREPIDFIAPGGPSALAAGDFDGDGSLDLAVTLSGGGVVVLPNYPVIALSPNKLSFGNQKVGTTSAALTTLVSNPSAALISNVSITIIGANPSDFAKTDTCDVKIPAGKNCTVSVTFTPKATGARMAAVVITDSALAGKQLVLLRGTGQTVTLSEPQFWDPVHQHSEQP